MIRHPVRLYDLLPVLYHRQGAVSDDLAQFFGALQIGYDAVVADIERFYENLFIATCSDDVLPELAALVGIDEIVLRSNRRFVANALDARRRKGTLTAVEMVTRDVSGWRVVARDAGVLMGVTQDVEQVRAGRGRYVDVADVEAIASIGSPADDLAQRPSVRTDDERGASTVDLYVYDHEWYALDCLQLNQQDEGRYSFDPFGLDRPIRLESGHTPDDAVRPPVVMGVPSVRRSPTNVEPIFGRIRIEGRDMVLPYGDVVVADLDDWHRPPGPSPAALVDLRRGRLTLAPGIAPEREPTVLVDVFYAFGADLGGGPYPRRSAADAGGSVRTLRRTRQLLVDVDVDTHTRTHTETNTHTDTGSGTDPGRHPGLAEGDAYGDLTAAVAAPRHPDTAVRIDDNSRYEIGDLSIDLDAHCRLTIDAAPGVRPTLVGDLLLSGRPGSAFVLSGVCLHGRIIGRGEIDLTVRDCTVWPSSPEPSIGTGESGAFGSIEVIRSITADLAAGERTVVRVSDSIVGLGTDSTALSCERLASQRATFMGPVSVATFDADSSLFVETVEVGSPSGSCAQRSYFARNPSPPWRTVNPPANDGGGVDLASPSFGSPRYAQIAWSERDALLTGGENGSEVGAYNMAHRARRRAALEQQALVFVPFGFDVQVDMLDQAPPGREDPER